MVNALPDQAICLPAANALRDLCDNNRVALAPHIASFGELHAGLSGISDFEKAKVLQSIASVIQALPLDDQISPVEVSHNESLPDIRSDVANIGHRLSRSVQAFPSLASILYSMYQD